MRVESIPMQTVADPVIRNALDVLQRNIQAIAGDKGIATKADVDALKTLINSTAAEAARTPQVINQTVQTAVGDALPKVSGRYNEIWTLEQAPPDTDPFPASLQIINQSPGMNSPVDAVNGTTGSPVNFAQLNLVGSYVYPAASMNSGFGGFLNFITRNLAGTQRQAAFVNGGLIGTTANAERGDLDLGIYGPPKSGVGNNEHRIVALRAEAGGTLALTVDNDDQWDIGDSVNRWRKAFFSDVVQCAGVDLNFNTTAPWVARLANPSSQIVAGPFGTLAGYMVFYWNATPVHVPCYVAP